MYATHSHWTFNSTGCGLTDEKLGALVRGLEKSTSITTMGLSKNLITDRFCTLTYVNELISVRKAFKNVCICIYVLFE